jgi:hypothetical protein
VTSTGTTLNAAVAGSKCLRNVAIGAYMRIPSSGSYYTVTAKANDESLTLSGSPAQTNVAFTYVNPTISDTGTNAPLRQGCGAIVNLEMGKQSSAFKMAIPTMDSTETIAMDMDGVERQINIGIDFAPGTATIQWKTASGSAQTTNTINGSIDNMIWIVESLIDGQQFVATDIPTLDITRPTHTYKVYVSDVKWKYVAGEPSHIMIDISMIERGL